MRFRPFFQSEGLLRKAVKLADAANKTTLKKAFKEMAKFYSRACSNYDDIVPSKRALSGERGKAEFITAFNDLNEDRHELWEALSKDQHWAGWLNLTH
jgi:hypothetical protein